MADAEGEQPRRAEPSPFGWLLLGHRRAAGLTQEDLASAAGMSVRTLSNLERGHARAAQPRSAEALCDALGLDGEQRRNYWRRPGSPGGTWRAVQRVAARHPRRHARSARRRP